MMSETGKQATVILLLQWVKRLQPFLATSSRVLSRKVVHITSGCYSNVCYV